MKFKDYNYERYSYEAYAEAMQQAGTRLKEAKDYQSFKKAFDEGKRAFEHLDTMYNICYVRYTIMCIGYAFRPDLSSRLTWSGRTFLPPS